MPKRLPDRDNLGPLLEQVGGKAVPSPVAVGRAPRALRLARLPFLARCDRQRVVGLLLIPQHILA
jgi:hypothetical protein